MLQLATLSPQACSDARQETRSRRKARGSTWSLRTWTHLPPPTPSQRPAIHCNEGRNWFSSRFHLRHRQRRHGGASGRLVPCGTLHISGVPLSHRAVRGLFEGHVPGVERHVGSVVAALRSPPCLPRCVSASARIKGAPPDPREGHFGRRYALSAFVAVDPAHEGIFCLLNDRSRPTFPECPPRSRLLCFPLPFSCLQVHLAAVGGGFDICLRN